MADGDLYNISLEPEPGQGTGEYRIPNPARPNGSIGGSDVGGNEEDDQRVRDLMQQFMNSQSIIDMLNNLLIVNNPLISSSGDTLVAEFFNSDDVVLISASPSGGIGATVSGTSRTVTFPGGPLRYNVGALFGIDYLPLAAGFAAFTGAIDIYMRLYIDGSLTFSSGVEQGMRFQAATDVLLSRVTLRDVVLLEPGKQLNHVEGTVSAANMTTRLAAGDHTVRVDITIVYPDDQSIQIDMWNEYFAFEDADTTKITSLQTYDATTIL